MKLIREQREALTRALVHAFPSYDDLDQLTQFKLGVPLNTITKDAALMTLALRVVNWTEAHDTLFPSLIAGALNQNPDNSDLQLVARSFELDEGAGAFEARVLPELDVSDVEPWRADMMRSERATCRIELQGEANGTGFLVGTKQVLTARHVVSSVIDGNLKLRDLTVRFDRKLRANGKTVQAGVVYDVAAVDAHDEPLDFALLRLTRKAADESVASQPGAPQRGFLVPEPWEFRETQPLFVIQHPSGDPLKFAAGSVTGVNVKPDRIAHNATTAPGSSGSPVFSSDWKTIGLHHWGGADHNRLVPLDKIAAKLRESTVAIGE